MLGAMKFINVNLDQDILFLAIDLKNYLVYHSITQKT